jgi:hypothetical protein
MIGRPHYIIKYSQIIPLNYDSIKIYQWLDRTYGLSDKRTSSSKVLKDPTDIDLFTRTFSVFFFTWFFFSACSFAIFSWRDLLIVF